MPHYLDICLRADPEFSPQQLMAALYAKLHRALVQCGSDSVAVSFPGYDLSNRKLGDHLRLLSSHDGLMTIKSFDWLSGLRDHVKVGEALPVPSSALCRTLRRVQAKSSPERLLRRQIKRHGAVAEQAFKKAAEWMPERLDLPYLRVVSASTGQTFKLFLRLGPVVPTVVAGTFNAYGLSTTATIPWF